MSKPVKLKPFLNILFGAGAGLGSFLLMLAAIMASAGVTLGFGYVLKNLVDNGFIAQSGHELNKSLIILLCMVAALAAAAFVRLTLSGYVSERVAANLRTRAFTHLISQDAKYFDSAHSHALSSGIASDTALIQGVLATALPQIVRNILMVIGGLAMLMMTSSAMTLLVVAVLPMVALPVMLVGRVVRKNSRKAQDETQKIGELTGEALSHIQVVQSFTLEQNLTNQYAAATARSLSAAMRQILTRSFMVSCIILILFASICVVLWHGAHEVMAGNLSAGDLTSFVFYSGLVAAAFGVLGDMGASLYRASGAMSRINDILSLTPSIKDGNTTPIITGEVTFNDVTFAYNDTNVLDTINLSITKGTTVALVGPSGSGKTTIFKLLMRMYDPNSGAITLNNNNLTDIKTEYLRQHIAYVPQDAALFSGTVRENIAYGLPDADDVTIIAAATEAQAHDFITSLPNGYDTIIGERGMTLSGGQRQRIALARALVKSAPILLLDEATAALDTANEKAIQKTLAEQHGRRTIIIIAHRLSTVMQADNIFVLKGGSIVETGNHESLIAKGGLYANMVNSQLLSDTPNA